MLASSLAAANSASNRRTFSLAVAKAVKLAGALGAFKIEVPDKTLDYRQFMRACLGLAARRPSGRGLGHEKSQLALA
jgi:hypothetical protein